MSIQITVSEVLMCGDVEERDPMAAFFMPSDAVRYAFDLLNTLRACEEPGGVELRRNFKNDVGKCPIVYLPCVGPQIRPEILSSSFAYSIENRYTCTLLD